MSLTYRTSLYVTNKQDVTSLSHINRIFFLGSILCLTLFAILNFLCLTRVLPIPLFTLKNLLCSHMLYVYVLSVPLRV
jgi:hypothetical protein